MIKGINKSDYYYNTKFKYLKLLYNIIVGFGYIIMFDVTSGLIIKLNVYLNIITPIPQHFAMLYKWNGYSKPTTS